jgi:hypothetical protein
MEPLRPAAVRRFGRAADLDIAFDGVDRPSLVTALLAHCSETADADTWWAQRVSDRIATLLRLAALSDGVEGFAVRHRCPTPECGTDFEMVVPAAAIAGQPDPDPITVPLPEGGHALVRPPTGEDQRRWSQRPYASQDEAVAAIVGALVIGGAVDLDDDRSRATIAAALAERDPLVDFRVACTCPSCAHPMEFPIDLEAMALARLAAVRQSLLDDVHALASAYGWTEREILAVPPDRRASYIALIHGANR